MITLVPLLLNLIQLQTADPGISQDILKQISIPIIDISDQTERHVIIAQGTETAWQGHFSTLLMPDGKTIYCVWQGRRNHSREHGAPAGYLKRSDDGGRTWSDYINVPANWLEIGRGHPTIHRLVDPKGTARLFIFCRDADRSTFLQAMSEDDGETWSEPQQLPLALSGDRHLARYAPDGRLVILFRPSNALCRMCSFSP